MTGTTMISEYYGNDKAATIYISNSGYTVIATVASKVNDERKYDFMSLVDAEEFAEELVYGSD